MKQDRAERYASNDLQAVNRLMKQTKDKRLYERYLCVSLHLSGETPARIAGILQRGTDTVKTYIKKYQAKGLEGLQMQHSPGRPARLTAEQEQELYQILVEKRPADVGFQHR